MKDKLTVTEAETLATIIDNAGHAIACTRKADGSYAWSYADNDTMGMLTDMYQGFFDITSGTGVTIS